MSRIRFREEEPSVGSVVASLAVGALAGFAVGVVVAQKVGGISGIRTRLRRGFAEHEDEEREEYRRGHEHAYVEEGEDELVDDYVAALEERVLEAFQEDAVLRERAVDIGAIGAGVIELTGWVDSDDESQHATAVARGVPGVSSVVNRLSVGDEDAMDAAEFEETDAGRPNEDELDTNEPLAGGRWEGNRIGTGRRRQGTSDERDRHADPKPELEDKWLDERHAEQEAAGEIEGIAERRRRGKKSPRPDRTEGGPIAPGGVPKGDHVVDPEGARDVDPNT
ncbi:MAG TPA: BON domain-containing protein [Gemmatimonadaceae bacterium]|nr:BON domain-containing protein [Gemmatimonadaceae bacterium]